MQFVVSGNMAQQSGFRYVAQDNFSDPIGQFAETRRQMCKINWLT
jgi:hypothetical protein